ncbi:ACT domain-containing protein [Lysobacter sp. F60174L2]|uniref:ACT domain-containing protein n=1 Tax=Lysobacter sp. F60174L2 TaxID=3459295 RepID=UPI00403DD609
MQRYRVELTLRKAEGALMRALGTTERRGFRPIAVDAESGAVSGTGTADCWHLRLSVESERPAALLQTQLEKLYDCLTVEVQPCR